MIAADIRFPNPAFVLRDANTGKERVRFRGSVFGGLTVALSPNARWLARTCFLAMGDDKVSGAGYVSLWDCTTGREARRVKIGDNCLAVSDDGSRVWTAGACWDGVTGKQVYSAPVEPKGGVTEWGWAIGRAR